MHVCVKDCSEPTMSFCQGCISGRSCQNMHGRACPSVHVLVRTTTYTEGHWPSWPAEQTVNSTILQYRTQPWQKGQDGSGLPNTALFPSFRQQTVLARYILSILLISQKSRSFRYLEDLSVRICKYPLLKELEASLGSRLAVRVPGCQPVNRHASLATVPLRPE